MPYADAASYHLNPFDLTKVWPHSDYPLVEVGTMTLDRNVENFFAEIEQAAFEPSALVPGIGFSPGQDAAGPGRRLRRHAPLPDRPELPPAAGQPTQGRGGDQQYSFDGRWPTTTPATRPSTPPNSQGRGYADQVGEMPDGWESDGAMVRQAYTLREDDDDWSQAGAMVRDVWTDEQRDMFVETVATHLLGGVRSPVLEKAFEYWQNVDADTGKKIEERVRAGQAGANPGGMPDEAKEGLTPYVEDAHNASR